MGTEPATYYVINFYTAATRTVTFSGLNVNQTINLVVTASQNAKADLKLSYSPPAITSPTTAAAGITHTLVFTATDAAGNATAPLAYNVTLATQKPAISLDGNSIQNNGALAQGAQISGTVTDKAAITRLGYQFDNGTVTPVAFSSASTTGVGRGV